MTTPIFIIGAQRSGTTLLRLLLNAHSQIAIPEEAIFLLPLLSNKNIINGLNKKEISNFSSYLQKDEQFRLWNYDSSLFFSWLSEQNHLTVNRIIDRLYYSFAQTEGKTIWGDKTPGFFRCVDTLAKLYPEAKFIHIVRDGRDVFCSMRKMMPQRNDPTLMALDWMYKTKKIESSFRRNQSLLKTIIRYEDLTANPADTVKNICKFLGIEFETGMLQFYKKSTSYIGTHHSSKIFNKVATNSCWRWKKELSQAEANIFEFIASKTIKRYGYPLSAKKALTCGNLCSIAKSLVTFVPGRFFEAFRLRSNQNSSLIQGTKNKYIGTGKISDSSNEETQK